MMAEHTPGPWSAQMDAGDWIGVEAVTGDGDLVRREICTCLTDDDDREDRANARLIAAAPDLLAACELFVAIDLTIDSFGEWLELRRTQGEARQAIAKACGKVPESTPPVNPD